MKEFGTFIKLEILHDIEVVPDQLIADQCYSDSFIQYWGVHMFWFFDNALKDLMRENLILRLSTHHKSDEEAYIIGAKNMVLFR